MGDNHLMLFYYEARKKFLEIIKEACGNKISLTKLPVGGYTILYIEEDGKVLYIADQGDTGNRVRVWCTNFFQSYLTVLSGIISGGMENIQLRNCMSDIGIQELKSYDYPFHLTNTLLFIFFGCRLMIFSILYVSWSVLWSS